MLKRLLAFGVPAALLLAALPWTGRAEPFSAVRFEQYLESLRQQAGIPGLSAVIVQNGRIAWEKGFGQADIERNIAARPDTPYPIGGATASAAAALLLDCADRGLVDLDERVTASLASFAEPATTWRQVLSHTTPLGRFVYDPVRFDAIIDPIKKCSGQTLRATYAALLDRLAMVDAVPGDDFAGWSPSIRALFDAATLDRYAAVMARLARPYRVSGRSRPVLSSPPTGLRASTGLVASARDVALLQIALEEGLVVDRNLLSVAWTPTALADGRPHPHGLGWFVQVYKGEVVVWQFGTIPDAYSSLVISVPRLGVSLVLLANSDGLNSPFPLADGDVTVSLFARFFLGSIL
jgi:CubicO group peptidase (beta-lactamase class C family)